jgi:hypothetical protein
VKGKWMVELEEKDEVELCGGEDERVLKKGER